VGQIGEPVRRYTVIPLEEPVSPTHEPVVPPPPPEKSPTLERADSAVQERW
jgi:hypothetical protein